MKHHHLSCRLVATCLAFLGFHLVLTSQVIPDTAFAVTNTDRNWLNYYTITNDFDSAVISVDYGEMLVRTGTSKRRVKPVTFHHMNDWYQNSGEQGLQTGIASLARWDTVTLSNASQLRFYRHACIKPFVEKTPFNPTGTPVTWSVGDTTIYLLEVRDYVADTLLFVADSIVFYPCSKGVTTRYYGTGVGKTYHTANCPTSSWGKKAYIRVAPRRYGASDLGLAFACGFAEVAQSLVVTSDTTILSSAQYQHLDSLKFHYFMAHLAAYWRTYCHVPDYSGIGFSAAQMDSITSLYWDYDTTIAGVAYFLQRACESADSCNPPQPKRNAIADGMESGIRQYPSEIRLREVVLDGLTVRATVYSTTNSRLVGVRVYNMQGELLAEAQPRRVSMADVSFAIDISGVAPTALLVRVFDDAGQTAGTAKLAR